MEFSSISNGNKLGLVNPYIIEKTFKTNSLPRKYFNLNFIIFIGFLLVAGFTLWYKYTKKQSKLNEEKLKEVELDKQFNEVMELVAKEEIEKEIIREEKQDEYIDLDGWANLSL
jgi:NhaP-type Na+/H+ and K+/H+ antiporter